MNIFTGHPRARWAVPGLAVLALGASAVLVSADASEPLPPRTAAQLLADVQQAKVAAFSGTVVQSANLGLPDLGGLLGRGGSADLSGLIAGSHTLRVWYAGPTRVRLALLGDLGESDVIRRDKDVWIWSSAAKTANHFTLPAGHDLAEPPKLPVTPADAAEQALAAVSPTTTVTTEGSAVVAGRTAYELVLTPKAKDGTLVRSVRIAVDGETKLPLRVQVNSTKITDPALEVGFTSVDFSTPEDRQFTFTPPPGTTVTEGAAGLGQHAPGQGQPRRPELPSGKDQAKPTSTGTGWSRVVVVTLPPGAADNESVQGVLDRLPKVSGSWGSGRLFAGTLVSAVLTDDGRLAAGAVPPERLYAALARS
ncbi:MAG: hypothetical protein V9G19_27490 [Tetrasphaera sp.]